MGKIVFGSFLHNADLEAKEELGPFVARIKMENLRNAMETGKVFREFRDNDLIYLMNTRVTPITGTNDVLVTGDRVRFDIVDRPF